MLHDYKVTALFTKKRKHLVLSKTLNTNYGFERM